MRLFKKNSKIKLGFIEILIIIILGMLLCGGFINMWKFNRNNVEQSLSKQPLAKKVLPLIAYYSNLIRRSRYANDTILSDPYQGTVQLFPNNAQLRQATKGNQHHNDTITVQYQGNKNHNVFDCHGTLLRPNQTTVSHYYINPKGDLVCAMVVDGIANLKQTTVVVENCEAMHIRYGYDSDSDGKVNHYISPDMANISLDNILSARISLLLRTNEIANDVLDPKFYTLQDTELGPFKDPYLRRAYTTTIPLSRFGH